MHATVTSLLLQKSIFRQSKLILQVLFKTLKSNDSPLKIFKIFYIYMYMYIIVKKI